MDLKRENETGVRERIIKQFIEKYMSFSESAD